MYRPMEVFATSVLIAIVLLWVYYFIKISF